MLDVCKYHTGLLGLKSLGFREATEMSWIKSSEGDELDQDKRSLDQQIKRRI